MKTLLFAIRKDMPDKGKKVLILTTGQPSTNPRMLKEFLTLKAKGYEVRVLYCFWAGWARKNDEAIIRAYPDCFKEVGGNPFTNKTLYFLSRLLYRIFSFLENELKRPNDFVQARASFFLKRMAAKYKADLYIAHNLGALPAAAHAAKKFDAKVGFDAEDFHRGESEIGSIGSSCAARIEDKYFEQLDYVTMSSPLIANAYERIYPFLKNVQVLRNVFSSNLQPSFKVNGSEKVKMIWFSQSLGLNRGLQDIFKALNLVKDTPVELTIIGHDLSNIQAQLLSIMKNKEHVIQFKEPLEEAELLNVCSRHHIGLALEPGFSENNKIALSNKIFTYLLAGNFVIASNTPAQALFFSENPSMGDVYPVGNVRQLADLVVNHATNLGKLNMNRKSNYDITRRMLCWDQEERKFLNIVENLI